MIEVKEDRGIKDSYQVPLLLITRFKHVGSEYLWDVQVIPRRWEHDTFSGELWAEATFGTPQHVSC